MARVLCNYLMEQPNRLLPNICIRRTNNNYNGGWVRKHPTLISSSSSESYSTYAIRQQQQYPYGLVVARTETTSATTTTTQTTTNSSAAAAAAAAAAGIVCIMGTFQEDNPNTKKKRIQCDYVGELFDNWDELTELEQFLARLTYHHMLLDDYKKRWIENPESKKDTTEWPMGIPDIEEVNALENDLIFCERAFSFLLTPTTTIAEANKDDNTNKDHDNNDSNEEAIIISKKNLLYCQKLKFRIASYYLLRDKELEGQKRGLKLIKQLAEQGYADGMCLYGRVLNEGKVAGIDANPNLAVAWWRKCIDSNRNHVPSIYEYAVALYTGEGIPENPELAVKKFKRLANSGHPGAAFMLGECLLDGIGIQRDRGKALERLVDAAELGNVNARVRVISVLERNYDDYVNSAKDESIRVEREDEKYKWGDEDTEKEKSLERRITIGGGSRNPKILKRRKSIVRDSRT